MSNFLNFALNVYCFKLKENKNNDKYIFFIQNYYLAYSFEKVLFIDKEKL